MHDYSHIQRVEQVLLSLQDEMSDDFNEAIARAALYFHGIIYTHEPEIKKFLSSLKLPLEDIDRIISLAWGSQKDSNPMTLEGILLHDAHMLEGGRNFEIIKSFITGSVRGQSLIETLQYNRR